METFGVILSWMLFGVVAGAIARFLVPGRQSIGMVATMMLGVVGSLVGGGLTWLVTGNPMEPAGWIMSILGAVIVLAIAVKTSSRRAT